MMQWRQAANSALAAVVDAGGVGGLGRGLVGMGAMGASAATGSGSQQWQHQHVRQYAKGAKGKQVKKKSGATPQAPTNASMKAAVDKHVSTVRVVHTSLRSLIPIPRPPPPSLKRHRTHRVMSHPGRYSLSLSSSWCRNSLTALLLC